MFSFNGMDGSDAAADCDDPFGDPVGDLSTASAALARAVETMTRMGSKQEAVKRALDRAKSAQTAVRAAQLELKTSFPHAHRMFGRLGMFGANRGTHTLHLELAGGTTYTCKIAFQATAFVPSDTRYDLPAATGVCTVMYASVASATPVCQMRVAFMDSGFALDKMPVRSVVAAHIDTADGMYRVHHINPEAYEGRLSLSGFEHVEMRISPDIALFSRVCTVLLSAKTRLPPQLVVCVVCADGTMVAAQLSVTCHDSTPPPQDVHLGNLSAVPIVRAYKCAKAARRQNGRLLQERPTLAQYGLKNISLIVPDSVAAPPVEAYLFRIGAPEHLAARKSVLAATGRRVAIESFMDVCTCLESGPCVQKHGFESAVCMAVSGHGRQRSSAQMDH